MTNLPLSRSGKNVLEVAVKAAKQAGEILINSFQFQTETRSKGRGNLVSEVDILSETAMIEILKDEYPDFAFVSEESNHFFPDSGFVWVIDPLDGTNNYVFGIPFFCVNLALVGDKNILLGITYDPLRKELFYAEKGKGTYLNGSPLYVSKKTSIQDCLVGLDLGYDAHRGRETLDIMINLWTKVHALRVMGSASLGLAYVACGRIDLYLHRFLYPWDIASGILLVKEAGGKVANWDGIEADIHTTDIIAANEKIQAEFISLLTTLGIPFYKTLHSS